MTLSLNWHSRLRAALIHLAASLLTAAVAAWLVFGLWYPHPYTAIAGGTELFYLLVSVDALVGPLLTFVVFSSSKPWVELRRDMVVVIALQGAALAYGLHTMAIARPAVLALEVDRFRVVTAQAVLEQELPQAPADLRSISWSGPRLVNIRIPASTEKADAVMMAMAGADLGMRPSFWLPWDDAARAAAKRAAKPAVELAARGATEAKVLAEAAARVGRPLAQLGYLPILARRSDWVALIDLRSGDLLGYAPVDGF